MGQDPVVPGDRRGGLGQAVRKGREEDRVLSSTDTKGGRGLQRFPNCRRSVAQHFCIAMYAQDSQYDSVDPDPRRDFGFRASVKQSHFQSARHLLSRTPSLVHAIDKNEHRSRLTHFLI